MTPLPPPGMECPSVFTFPNGDVKRCQRPHRGERSTHSVHRWCAKLPHGAELLVRWTQQVTRAQIDALRKAG